MTLDAQTTVPEKTHPVVGCRYAAEASEFVGFGTRQGGSRECLAGGAVWVDGAHSELIVACLLCSESTGQL